MDTYEPPMTQVNYGPVSGHFTGLSVKSGEIVKRNFRQRVGSVYPNWICYDQNLEYHLPKLIYVMMMYTLYREMWFTSSEVPRPSVPLPGMLD